MLSVSVTMVMVTFYICKNMSSLLKFGAIISRTNNHKNYITNHKSYICDLLKKLETLYNQKPINKQVNKNLRKLIISECTSLNFNSTETYNNIAVDMCAWMFSLESMKINGQLPKKLHNMVLTGFLTLIDCGITRYRKLPSEWIELGATGGLLEDLVVIMRIPGKTHGIGIGDKHIYSIEEVITGYRKYLENSNDPLRFIFLLHLFNNNNDEMIKSLIFQAIKHQGESKRLSIRKNNSSVNDNTYEIYTLQGLYGAVYDKSVTIVLSDTDDKPSIGIHFTRTDIAQNIWNQKATRGDIPVGHIMRFEKGRDIHALSCVYYDGEYYRINANKTSIRNRMTHGITTMNRPKYQSGLVLDINKMVKILPKGAVMLNEIGTLLVSVPIPHSCILACLDTELMLNKFWQLDTCV